MNVAVDAIFLVVIAYGVDAIFVRVSTCGGIFSSEEVTACSPLDYITAT